MKYLLLVVAATILLIAACTTGNQVGAVHITHARAAGPNCAFTDDTIYKERGSYDLSSIQVYGSLGADHYDQIFGWENTLDAIGSQVGGSTVLSPSANTFYVNQATLSYQASDPSVKIPTTVWNMSASITAGATSGANSVSVPLLPGNVPNLLDQAVTNPPITLLVNFSLQGTYGGSTNGTTSVFQFPLTIERSGVTTCSGNLFLPGECGVIGKDFPVACPGPGSDGGVYP